MLDKTFYKTGWRPLTGWICVSGLFYEIILKNAVIWLTNLLNSQFNINVPLPPNINMNVLETMLYALLGLGSLRTFEKVKNKDG